MRKCIVYAKTVNVEIKARCSNLELVRHALGKLDAVRHGLDIQIDTYFVVGNGRMKLREGTIENSLIYYRRPNQAGPKVSEVSRFDLSSGDGTLKDVLGKALPVKTVVRKKREIYFLSNIKIHLDEVEGLGSFLEIEAIDASGLHSEQQLDGQCRSLMAKLGVRNEDLIEDSYSDMFDPDGRGESLATAA